MNFSRIRYKYIKQIRLEKARQLLASSTYTTVKEAAYAVGLKDVKTFAKNFKDRYGKLPSELRDELC